MAAKKVKLAQRICDWLAKMTDRDRDHKLFDVVATGLQKMSVEEIDALLLVVSTEEMTNGIDRIKDAAKGLETTVRVPLRLMPKDIGNATTAQDVTEQLSMLPTIGQRVSEAWETGNFPVLKRNITITGRIVDNCRTMVARQLYNAIKIEESTEE